MTNTLKLLILEDNPSDMELILAHLRAAGFEPDWKRTDNEADYLAALDPTLDLILADYHLPQFNGVRALQLMQERGLDIPFILVSGTIGEETAVEAMKNGAADYMLKDRLARLGTAVSHALEQKRLRDEQRRFEEALRASDARLHLLSEATHDLTLLINRNGIIEYTNSFAAKQFGVSAQELIGKKISEIFPPETSSRQQANIQQVFDSHQPLYVEAPSIIQGEILWLGTWLSPVIDKLSDQANEILIVSRDITERKMAEEERTQLLNVLEASLNEIYLFDAETLHFQYVNNGALRNLGYSRAEIGSMTPLDLKPEFNEISFRNLLAPLLRREREQLIFQTQHRRADASLYPVEVHLQLVEHHGEQAFLAIILDITERKQVEEKLLESERFVLSILNALPSHIAVLDEDGTIIAVNQPWLEFSKANDGDPDKTGLGINYLDVCERANPKDELAAEIAVGIRAVMCSEKDTFSLEYPCHSPTEKRWFVAYVTRFQVSGPLRIVIKHENITERKIAEQTLRESESTLQKAQKVAHLGSWKWHIPNNQLEWSDEMYRIFGINKEAFTGKLTDVIATAVHPDDRIVVEQANLAVTHDKNPTPMEYRVVWPDGTVRIVWAEAGELILDEEGQPFILTGILQDITERKQAADALRSAELRYRTLIENSSEQVSIISPNGELMYESPSVSPLMGYQPGEFLGENIFQLIHPDDLERIQKLFAHLLQEPNQPVRDRFRLKHREGNWIWVEAVGKNLLGEPAISGIVINYHDITEQQKAERQIQYQAHLLTNVNDAIISTNENGKLTTWNAAAETTYGWKAEEVLGLSGNEIVQAQSPEAERLVMQRMLAERGRWRGEASHVRKDGTRFPVESSITVLYDEDGRITGYVSVSRDITERKKAEEKIQRQLHRLNILRKIDQGIAGSFNLHSILETILEEGMTELNIDAGVYLLYHPDNQALKYEIGIGMNTDALQYTKLKLGEGYAGKAAQSRETIFIPNLQKRNTDFLRSPSFSLEGFCCYFGVPLITKGEIKGVLEIFHRTPLKPEQEWLDFMETLAGQAAIAIDNAQLWELSKRHAQELEQRVAERTAELSQVNVELERASRIKDEFLANMSHELRTPLNSILGLSETLLEQVREPLSDHQQKYMRIIETSGRHLLELINDILDLSKIEAGKIDLYPEIIDVSMILQSSVTFIKQIAHQKSINIIYNSGDSATKIYADSRRLKQILINLLTNAVKFTPEHGTVALEVHSDPEQDRVQVSVTDTGIGIAPEDLKRLFQPFVQVDSALNRQQEGTGLGLALVRKLVDLHGGSVRVESEVGKGSRFTVNLPMGRDVITQYEIIRVKGKGSYNAQLTQTKEPLSNTLPHKMILLAEDNMANILTIGEYLESHDCVVKVAHNGLEAIEMAEETNPDIILMDIQMPVMDGLEAMRHIRANPRFAATPIIALTALAMPGDRERCLEAGANEYISKPASLKGLLETIKRLDQ